MSKQKAEAIVVYLLGRHFRATVAGIYAVTFAIALALSYGLAMLGEPQSVWFWKKRGVL